jgi:hypothetical protein
MVGILRPKAKRPESAKCAAFLQNLVTRNWRQKMNLVEVATAIVFDISTLTMAGDQPAYVEALAEAM